MNIHASKLGPRFRGLWIALAPNGQMLGSGKTADEAWQKAQKKRPATVTVTHFTDEDAEIPNDDLIAAMREGEELDRKGRLKAYHSVDKFLASLA